MCNKNEIIGAMGGGKPELLNTLVVEQIFERKIPSTILLTSDGIHESLSQDELEEVMEVDCEALDKAKKLCSDALEKGSEDDRSAIIIRFIESD